MAGFGVSQRQGTLAAGLAVVRGNKALSCSGRAGSVPLHSVGCGLLAIPLTTIAGLKSPHPCQTASESHAFTPNVAGCILAFGGRAGEQRNCRMEIWNALAWERARAKPRRRGEQMHEDMTLAMRTSALIAAKGLSHEGAAAAPS